MLHEWNCSKTCANYLQCISYDFDILSVNQKVIFFVHMCIVLHFGVYKPQAGDARRAAAAWFSGLICITKHAGANQIATRLPGHCNGPVCSQPASELTDPSPLRSCWPTCRYFWNMSFFGNDDSFRHKTQQMSCTWSSSVCVQNFAVVRRGVWPQNKQTLKYLVDLSEVHGNQRAG